MTQEEEPEALDATEINRHLTDIRCDNPALSVPLECNSLADATGKIHVFPSVNSTNTEAKDAVSQAPSLWQPDGTLSAIGRKLNGAVFIAEQQTGGRGRMGRAFFSPAGTGIYMSLVVVPAGGVNEAAVFTASAAVGVCRALQTECGIDAKIKWVNDIFLDGKKICGILTEGVVNAKTGTVEAAVIGIGLNLAEPAGGFPEEVSAVAGTIAGKRNPHATYQALTSRNRLVATLVHQVLSATSAAHNGDKAIMQEYRNRSLFTAGQELTVYPMAGNTSVGYSAYYKDIDDKARLVVQLPDGTLCQLNSGEVSLKSGSVADSTPQ